MRVRRADLPFIVVLMGIGAASMMVPAVHATVVGDYATARAFVYSCLLFLVLSSFVAVATNQRRSKHPVRRYLIALVAFYAVLPLMLAVPVYEAVGNTSFLNAYLEMVSSLTTTGASLFEVERLAPSVHLWRAQVGWMGGFFVWVTAVAVLAPINLGGFEVRSALEAGQGAARPAQTDRTVVIGDRIVRFASALAPVYLGLTAALWMALLIAGDAPLVAFCHAMSTIATSAISPIGGTEYAGSGFAGEALILLFLVFSLSRLTFSRDERTEGWASLPADPEIRMALSIVIVVSLGLFVRHWAGAFELLESRDAEVVLGAFWGGLFTTASFLTTTGFVSENWDTARAWSGLEAPGLILLGLAVFGGGVGTTAGGVRLLRVYALYKHGLREMEKLVQPSSIGGAGPLARQIRRQGAYVAWIFFMLFAISIAVFMAAFALAGQDFTSALILTISGLSTTGPLLSAASETPVRLDLLSVPAKALFGAAMVVGRLETLLIIALLNPDFWRR